MIIYLSSTIYSFVKIDDNIHFESSNELPQTKLKTQTSFFICAAPIDNNSYQTTNAKILVSNSSVTSENKNIIIIKHNSFTYEILILFDKSSSSTLFYKNKLNNNKDEILVFSNQAIVQKQDKLIKQDINFLFSDVNLIEKQKFVYLIFSDKESAHLMIFNKDKNLFITYSCDNLSINDEKIILISKNNDYNKTYSVSEIKLLDNSFNHYQSKKHPSDRICINENIIPYTFMQAIKFKDFTLARKYLTQEFSESLLDSHLEDFFGNFLKVSKPKIPLPPYSVTLIYFNKPVFTTRHFTFTYKDNKITNIYEN